MHAMFQSADGNESEDKINRTRVAIIGSGFGGLGAAIRLKHEGVEDFIILERASDVGGTWRDNTYPGCACDVESHLYSFSFAPNPNWTYSFSRQPEIWDYLRRCAREFEVLPHIRFNHEVLEAAWDDDAQQWRIETSQGSYAASVMILASGPFSEPVMPRLAGLETFRGKTFHSARWDHDYDLKGRSVAVIGTGASAVQFVPEIQPDVAKLYLFQRTPPWIIPRRDRRLNEIEHRLFRRFPAAQRLARSLIYLYREMFLLAFRHLRLAKQVERIARRHLERSIEDPHLRAKLLPDYSIGCKRVLISNDYLPSLTRPNIEVITDSIAEIRARTIVDCSGAEREVDTIIFGTGFKVTDPPLAKHIRGREGRTLAQVWSGSPQAHVGTMVAGFPNLFILLGPNTGLGHNSVVYMIEAQIEHLTAVLKHTRERGASMIEPRPEAQAAFVAGVQRRMQGTVWVAGGCASWYLDSTGRNSTIWPDFTWRFRRRAERFDSAEYLLGFPHEAKRPAHLSQPDLRPETEHV